MIKNLYGHLRERLRSLSRFGAYDGMMIRVRLSDSAQAKSRSISWSRALSNETQLVDLKNNGFHIEAPARGILEIRILQIDGRVCRIVIDGRCIDTKGRRILAHEAVDLALDLGNDDLSAFVASTERVERTGLRFTMVDEPSYVNTSSPRLLVAGY